MANPQLENGYTKIADELLDAFCRIRIPGEVAQVVWTIVRKTYGYGKKEDRMSLSQIAEKTGLSRSHVQRSLDKAKDHKIVLQNGYNLSLNKNYEEWVSFKSDSKVGTGKKNKGVPQSGQTVLQNGYKTVLQNGYYNIHIDNNNKQGTVAPEKNPENIYDFFANAWLHVYKKKAPRNIIDEAAIIRLAESYGIRNVCGLMAWAEKNRPNNQYIAVIKRPRDLEDKWNSIYNQYLRKDKNGKRSYKI